MIDGGVGGVISGVDVVDEESSIQEELFGEAADTEARGSETREGRREDFQEDSAE